MYYCACGFKTVSRDYSKVHGDYCGLEVPTGLVATLGEVPVTIVSLGMNIYLRQEGREYGPELEADVWEALDSKVADLPREVADMLDPSRREEALAYISEFRTFAGGVRYALEDIRGRTYYRALLDIEVAGWLDGLICYGRLPHDHA